MMSRANNRILLGVNERDICGSKRWLGSVIPTAPSTGGRARFGRDSEEVYEETYDKSRPEGEKPSPGFTWNRKVTAAPTTAKMATIPSVAISPR